MGAGATNSGDQGSFREIVALSPGQCNNLGRPGAISRDCCAEDGAAQQIREIKGYFARLLRRVVWDRMDRNG